MAVQLELVCQLRTFRKGKGRVQTLRNLIDHLRHDQTVTKFEQASAVELSFEAKSHELEFQ